MEKHFLVIGDAHIPDRETMIPSKIKEKIHEIRNDLPDEKFDKVLYTGDFTDSNPLFTLLSDVVGNDLTRMIVVLGNMDSFYNVTGKIGRINRKKKAIIELECNEFSFKILLIHGHQIQPRGNHEELMLLARDNDCSVILTGHTHADDIAILNNQVLLINPGSCTGAWSFLATRTPSFVHLTVNSLESDILNISLKLYKLERNVLREYKKKWNYLLSEGIFKL